MKKVQRFCWLVFFLLIIYSSGAQTPIADSLKQELIRNSVTNKYPILWGLAYELFDVDNPQAVEYAKQAHQLALVTGDTVDIVMSGRIMGQLLRRVDKIDESISIFSYVLPISKRWKLNKETRGILKALGVSFSLKGEYHKSLEVNLECLLIAQSENNTVEISRNLCNLGVLFSLLEDYKLSLDYYLQALELERRLPEKDQGDVHITLVNIALDYMELNDYVNANIYFDKGIKFCSPSCSPTIIIVVEYGLGKLLIKQGKYDEAEKHISKCYRLSKEESYKYYELASLAAMAKIALGKSDLTSALTYLNSAQLLVNEDRYKDLAIEFYKLSAEYYTEVGNYKKANFFLTKYVNLKESVFDARMRADFMASQIQYAQKDNLQRLDAQSKILSLQDESIKTQKLLIFSYGTIALMAMGIAVLLFRRNRQKQTINNILDQRVRERTIELEENRDELRRVNYSQLMTLRKISSESTSYLATMKGLANAAATDLLEEQAVYFRQAERTMENLFFSIKKHIPSDEI